MTSDEAMRRMDALLSHVWMVRTFVKHADETQEDEALQDVHRALYDYMLALGGPWQQQDAEAYLRMARKKYRRLKEASERFSEMQPDVSSHTNFQMAAQSLRVAMVEIGELLAARERQEDGRQENR